jgi:hypothetical protein
MTLHTFGDSHATTPWNKINIDEISILCNTILDQKTGGKNWKKWTMTCSFFGFQKLDAINIKNFNVKEEDIVCFCLGELDCRCHIHKHKEMYNELIDKIVENYFLAIKVNVEQFNNLKVIVVSVTPPTAITRYRKSYKYPILGSDVERVTYTQYMNSKIKEYCEKYNYMFLDVYNKYCDEEGLVNIMYSDKASHIKNPMYIREELIKLLNTQ